MGHRSRTASLRNARKNIDNQIFSVTESYKNILAECVSVIQSKNLAFPGSHHKFSFPLFHRSLRMSRPDIDLLRSVIGNVRFIPTFVHLSACLASSVLSHSCHWHLDKDLANSVYSKSASSSSLRYSMLNHYLHARKILLTIRDFIRLSARKRYAGRVVRCHLSGSK